MYEEMSFESVLEEMMDRIPDVYDKREGSIIHYALAPTAYYMMQMYFEMMNYPDLIFGDTAAAEYLDRFVGVYDVKRKEGTKAVRAGKFDKEVPIGSRFSTMEEPAFIFTVKELLKEESGIYQYSMECETPGNAGNSYLGTIIPVEYIQGLGSAELGEVLTEGTDKETDESLRKRFLAKVRRPSTSGNIHDYYNWVMSCSGVGAAKIFPLAKGPGTVKIVITSEDKTAADTSLRNAVKEYIDEVRPIGADVTVISAVEKIVNVGAKVKLTSGTHLGTVQNAFLVRVTKYLQEKAFHMDYISLARIGNLLLDVDGVEDYMFLTLNGVEENIAIQDEEVAVAGAVRLEVL